MSNFGLLPAGNILKYPYNERGRGDLLHHALYAVVEYGIIVFEIIGVALLLWAGVKGLIAVA